MAGVLWGCSVVLGDVPEHPGVARASRQFRRAWLLSVTWLQESSQRGIPADRLRADGRGWRVRA